MLTCLAPGTLLLFDLGYFSFAWFDALTKGNYPWVTRLREQTTMIVMHTYDDGGNWDKLVWLGIWDTQSAYLVRVVQVTYAGVTHRYLTNVLNPTVLPMRDLVGLYAPLLESMPFDPLVDLTQSEPLSNVITALS